MTDIKAAYEFVARASTAAENLGQNISRELLEHADIDPDAAELFGAAVETLRALIAWSTTTSDGTGAYAVQNIIGQTLTEAGVWDG